jgi:upstream activation factor subunit UAF30
MAALKRLALKHGKYSLESFLARGSGGTDVWLGRDANGSRVVIKAIPRPKDTFELKKARAYFNDEVEAGLAVGGPHVRRLIDHAELRETPMLGEGAFAKGAFCLALEYVPFGSLRDLLKKRQLSGVEIRNLAVAVSRGLAAAHERKPPITHRDLKPENILLPDGKANLAKVADFGIARMHGGTRLTSTGLGVGTVRYMPPEQFQNSSHVTPAADLYSLALVLAECLTNAVPYEGDDSFSTLQDRSRGKPINDIVVGGAARARVSDVLRHALTPNPSARHGSVRDFTWLFIRAGAEDGLWPEFEEHEVTICKGLQDDEVLIRFDGPAEENNFADLDPQAAVRILYSGDPITGSFLTWLLSRSQRPSDSRLARSNKGASRRKGRRKAPVNREPVRPSKSGSPPSVKVMMPSPELARIVGNKPIARTEITKRLWKYIKRHGLQDEENSRNINPDAKLKLVFGGRAQVSMFEMVKLVDKHLR